MFVLIILLFLVGLVFLSVSLKRTYNTIPLKELRRRARSGHQTAQALYRVTSYGVGVDLVLWFFIGLSSGLLFLLLVNELVWWVALPTVLVIIWLAFAWLPDRRVGVISQRSAVLIAPLFARLLSLLQPINSRIAIWFKHPSSIKLHTGLYEKEDLLELLDTQRTQIDNRITEEELVIARNSLTFGSKIIREIMTPRRVIVMVDYNESITPHIMDELHATGFSRFPVVDKSTNTDKIVGTLYLKDLVGQKAGGSINHLMKPDVFFLNEESSLLHALNAFIKTKHHLFIVVNNFEEIVGVVSIEDVLEQLLGQQIVDEFDAYDDLRVVASLQAEQDRGQATETDHHL